LACECAALTGAGAGTGGSVGTGAGSGAHADAGPAAQVNGGAISDPAGNSSAARFDWKRTTPTGGSCEAGHYVGAFTGTYNPGGLLSLTPLPVASVDNPVTGAPGLELWLNKRPGSEIFDASGGKVKGNANALYPFEIDLTGSLDCTAGKFTGQLDGWYDASSGLGIAKSYFAGPVTADYDKITHQFVNGTWTVLEKQPDGGLPQLVAPGGNGTWNATWKK
jgi:hypothetical protein